MNAAELSNMFRTIREKLAPPSIGVWFQELESEIDNTGKAYWQLKGEPIISPEYYRLVGYDIESHMPANRMDVVAPGHRHSVAKKIYKAIHDPSGLPHECTFQVVHPEKDGRSSSRWILARASRLQQNSRTFLASWNTDITDLREREAFYEKVLATIPGFVFLKEFDSATNGGVFRFSYCNERLTEELKKCPTKDDGSRSSTDFYVGKTDFDFFPNEQAENFRRNDLKAFHAGGQQITIAEEQFTPQAVIPNAKTLTTVKVRFDTLDHNGSRSNCVLGVAIDLSSVMQLLRAAVDACNDAIFIKDTEHRYVYVNQTFRAFIGVDEHFIVEGKTFKEIQEQRYIGSFPSGLRDLIATIEQNDRLLLEGGESIDKEQLAFYSDKKVWRLEKRRVGFKEKGFHVLGVARHKLDPQRINTQIIKNSPQFICIKDSDLRVIHCNWNFAQRRNRPIEECFGKTDFDFWPEDKYPGQAIRFQERDREVLKLLPEIEALEIDTTLSDSEKRKWRRDILSQHTSYEEFCGVEEMMPDGSTRLVTHHLVTTKWPDRINGEPVLHVLYADDTDAKIGLKEAVSNLEIWHRYTIHAIGNETAPLLGALLEVKKLLQQVDSGHHISRDDIQSVHNKLLFGKHGMDFYVNNHLKFISGKFDLSRKISIGELVRKKISEFDDINVEYAKFTDCEIEPGSIEARTHADEVFLKAAVTEMLRNALKATERRYGEGFSSPNEATLRGAIRVKCRLRPSAGRIKQECIVVSVQDNGDGCVEGSVSQQKLQAAFERVYGEQFNHSHEFGMRFLHSVAKGHRGELNLTAKIGSPVEFHLVIPIKE